ncbi:MAG: hypothetical protein ACTSPQ_09270 [Candidatus Helarchaeota archaeon]
MSVNLVVELAWFIIHKYEYQQQRSEKLQIDDSSNEEQDLETFIESSISKIIKIIITNEAEFDKQIRDFIDSYKELWMNIIYKNKKVDEKLIGDFINIFIKLALLKIPLPEDFLMDEFVNFFKLITLNAIGSKDFGAIVDLLQFVNKGFEEINNLDIDDKYLFEIINTLFEILENFYLSQLNVIPDIISELENIDIDSNIIKNSIHKISNFLRLLIFGLKSIMQLIEDYIISYTNDKSSQIESKYEKMVDTIFELNEILNIMNILSYRVLFTMLIWNIPKTEFLSSNLNDPDIFEKIDFKILPPDEFFINLNKSIDSILKEFLEFTFKKLNISLQEIQNSINNENKEKQKNLEVEENKKRKILEKIFPNKNFKDFKVNKEALDELLNCLDEILPEDLDIEKILNEDNFNMEELI